MTYEQEALYDRTRDKFHDELVYPRSTIESEHTVVVIDRNIALDERVHDAVRPALLVKLYQRDAEAFLEGQVVLGGIFLADIAPIPATVTEQACLHSSGGDIGAVCPSGLAGDRRVIGLCHPANAAIHR